MGSGENSAAGGALEAANALLELVDVAGSRQVRLAVALRLAPEPVVQAIEYAAGYRFALARIAPQRIEKQGLADFRPRAGEPRGLTQKAGRFHVCATLDARA